MHIKRNQWRESVNWMANPTVNAATNENQKRVSSKKFFLILIMLSSFHYHFSTGKKEGRQGKLKVIMTATIHYHYHYHCHSLLQTHNNNPMSNTRSQKTTRKRDLFNFLSFHKIFILLHHMFKSMPKVVLPPPISYVTPQGMVTYCHRNFNSS